MPLEPGHTVLVVPVPELEGFVRSRWEHYAPELVSDDAAFTHAHVTALAPYLVSPLATDLALVASIAAATPAFDFELRDVAVFPDGLMHLRPDPVAPFAALTARLWEAFPRCPPYEGRYDDVTPHLTLDRVSPTVTVASTRALLADAVPVRCRAERLELHWYQTRNCHVMASWPLGGTPAPVSARESGGAGDAHRAVHPSPGARERVRAHPRRGGEARQPQQAVQRNQPLTADDGRTLSVMRSAPDRGSCSVCGSGGVRLEQREVPRILGAAKKYEMVRTCPNEDCRTNGPASRSGSLP